MSDKTATTIRLGKFTIEPRFTFESFDRMNMEHGVNALRASSYINFDPSVGATLVWGCQLHTKKPLTREQILKHMPTDTDEYVAMMTVVARALNRALGGDRNAQKK